MKRLPALLSRTRHARPPRSPVTGRRAGSRSWAKSLLIAAVLVVPVVLMPIVGPTETGASALCGAGAHYYAGEDLLASASATHLVAGIERFVSKPTLRTFVDYTAQIAAFIMGNYALKTKTVTPKVCHKEDTIYTCHLQSAIALGDLDTETHSSLAEVTEEWTYYGYYVFWHTYTIHSNNFINSYWTGTTEALSNGHTLGLFDSYYAGPNGNTTVHLLGTAWLNEYRHQGDTAYYEYTSSGTYVCPRIVPYTYYGTNGSGTSSTSTVLAYYNGTRKWVNFPKTSSRYEELASTPYFYTQITSYRSFKVDGGVAT